VSLTCGSVPPTFKGVMLSMYDSNSTCTGTPVQVYTFSTGHCMGDQGGYLYSCASGVSSMKYCTDNACSIDCKHEELPTDCVGEGIQYKCIRKDD
jgi:hypothetical protein